MPSRSANATSPTALPDPVLWGIDLGGTKIEGVIVDAAHPDRAAHRVRLTTESDRGYDHVVGRIRTVIETLEQHSGLRRAAVSSAPPPTNARTRPRREPTRTNVRVQVSNRCSSIMLLSITPPSVAVAQMNPSWSAQQVNPGSAGIGIWDRGRRWHRPTRRTWLNIATEGRSHHCHP